MWVYEMECSSTCAVCDARVYVRVHVRVGAGIGCGCWKWEVGSGYVGAGVWDGVHWSAGVWEVHALVWASEIM